jgi:hypothetical protein
LDTGRYSSAALIQGSLAMTPDDLALAIAQREARQGGGRISFDDATLVIDTLASLGYEFVAHGVAGRFCDSDEQKHCMAMNLSRKTALHIRAVYVVLNTIDTLGLRIREPDQHPSGLRTNAYAHEDVKQIARNIYPT